MLDAISFLLDLVNDACHSLNILSTDLNFIHLSVSNSSRIIENLVWEYCRFFVDFLCSEISLFCKHSPLHLFSFSPLVDCCFVHIILLKMHFVSCQRCLLYIWKVLGTNCLCSEHPKCSLSLVGIKTFPWCDSGA